MCLKCHLGLSDEAVLEQFRQAVLCPQYERWNSTSLSHCFIAAAGVSGDDARLWALRALDGFICHIEQDGKTEFFLDDCPSVTELREQQKEFTDLTADQIAVIRQQMVAAHQA